MKKPTQAVIRATEVSQAGLVVLTGDDAPMPRATKKETAAAKKRAESASRVNQDVAKQIAAQPKKPKAPRKLKPGIVDALPETDDVLNGDGSAWASRETFIAAATKQVPVIPTTGYQGPMLALRDRLKDGKYKKAANGQPSCGDEVANVLGTLEPTEVIRACLIALDIGNPYLHLNIGQQSMNLRNKLRGALKHEKFGMGVLREAVEEVIEARPAKLSPSNNI